MIEEKRKGFKQFFMLDGSGNISHTKIWSNIGYAAFTGVFVYASIFAVAVDPTLLMVFGSVVIGNRTLKVALKDFKPSSK